MTASARGLFRATGKRANPVMTDLADGVAVYADEVAREKDDFYPTPPEPTRAILKAERAALARYGAVWEPACGDGAMLREMQAAGLNVVASDLIDRGCGAEIRSFYDFRVPPAWAMLTNPPFAECNSGAWIRHALDVLHIDYMALLLPLNWIGAETRAGLWARHPPARVYVMRWRIDFTGGGAPPMLNAWFVWDGKTALGDTRFLMLSKADALGEGFL
ncbi:hypothetical protein [Pseudorhodobacter sp.]|uniref:hypothetical protein n=1 Tax=Pseudorhodobacter sp. TaxID=1934400 RepID=UPI00264A2085|nr:hypothetical protein [Pseudorhodobacter sp.]MDN5789038.1 hypothetical protein [Pseudorhodobacter sp.]